MRPLPLLLLLAAALQAARAARVTRAEAAGHPPTAARHVAALLPLLPEYELLEAVRAAPVGRAEALDARGALGDAAAAAAAAAHPDEERLHPTVLRYEFEALGHQFRLRLHKNHALMHPDYTETRLGEGGRVLAHKTRREVQNCHYVARVESDTAERPLWAALSTCRGLRGTIHAHGGSFVIEPLAGEEHVAAGARHPRGAALVEEMRHVVYRLSDLPDEHQAEFHCGHDQTPEERQKVRAGMEAAAAAEAARGPEAARAAAAEVARGARKHAAAAAAASAPPLSSLAHGHAHAPHGDDDDAAAAGAGHAHAHAHGRAAHTLASQLSSGVAYPEVLAVNDFFRFEAKEQETEIHTGELFNLVSAMYTAGDTLAGSGTAVQLILRAQITLMSSTSPLSVTEAADGGANVDFLLEDFADYRRSLADELGADHHDNGALLSGKNFEQSIVGYAYTFGMCRPSQTASINQVNHYTADAFDAATLAHELGHNLGMCHDPPAGRSSDCDLLTAVPDKDTACSGFVMSASSSTSDPNIQFSQCSREDWRHFVQTDSPSFGFSEACMDVKAEGFETYFNVSECGNGFRELDETCDCGTNTSSCADQPAPFTDLCCDSATCRLTSDAQCSQADPCCTSSCQIAPAGTVCRPVDTNKDACDVEEVCDGTLSSCPADRSDCSNTGAGFLQEYTTEIIVGCVGIVVIFVLYKCLCSTWACCCGEGDPKEDGKKGKAAGGKSRSGRSKASSGAGAGRKGRDGRSRQHKHRAAAPAPAAAAPAVGVPSLPPGWQVRYRANGQPVYVNSVTGEVYDFSAAGAQ